MKKAAPVRERTSAALVNLSRRFTVLNSTQPTPQPERSTRISRSYMGLAMFIAGSLACRDHLRVDLDKPQAPELFFDAVQVINACLVKMHHEPGDMPDLPFEY